MNADARVSLYFVVLPRDLARTHRERWRRSALLNRSRRVKCSWQRGRRKLHDESAQIQGDAVLEHLVTYDQEKMVNIELDPALRWCQQLEERAHMLATADHPNRDPIARDGDLHHPSREPWKCRTKPASAAGQIMREPLGQSSSHAEATPRDCAWPTEQRGHAPTDRGAERPPLRADLWSHLEVSDRGLLCHEVGGRRELIEH
jgi:hypothetical protein